MNDYINAPWNLLELFQLKQPFLVIRGHFLLYF
jgi:hypothetical protein